MDKAGPASPKPDETEPSAGERLRAAREAQGLSLKEVARTTLQSRALLQRLEDMQTDSITPTVLRLYARSYANALGLPEKEIADGFAPALERPATETSLGQPIAPVQGPGVSTLLPLAGGAVALGLVALVALAWPGSGPTMVKAPVASKVRASPVPPALRLGDTPRAGPELGLHAVNAAMIEVRASDGTVFRNRRMAAGEVYYPRLGSGWTVTVQDAGAFEWWLDDMPLRRLGDAGVPAYGVSVDEALSEALQSVSDAMAETGENRQTRR